MLTTFYSLFFLLVVLLALILALRPRSNRPPHRKFQFAELWKWRGRVGRGTYATVGVIGFAIKHNIDRAVATLVFHRPFGIFNYWIPPVDAIRISSISQDDALFLITMVAVALPFVWIGLGMTLRRLRCAGLPLWLVFLFFAPVVNVAFFLILSLIPESRPREERVGAETKAGSLIPNSVLGSAAAAVTATGAIGAVLAYVGVQTIGMYGWGVFVALPFCLGLGSVMIHTYHQPRPLASCILVSVTAVALVAIALFAFAVEGLICILMAIPIATPLALLGGLIGFLIQRGKSISAEAPSMMLLAVFFPLSLMGFEKLSSPEASLHTVTTTVRIEAPAGKIWTNLISFPDLPASKEWLFRLGVSHPIRATIEGAGIGATRKCLFSTGTFVERIDAWEENKRMAFSVMWGAGAMREFSPYDIHPRHLDGYFAPEGAEFRLIPNADGSTNLEGKSWYRNSMWPSPYWRLWSDKILHDIHLSVFEHIKTLAER